MDVTEVLVDRPIPWDFATNYAYGNIHYVVIPTVRAIDQNVLHLPKPR